MLKSIGIIFNAMLGIAVTSPALRENGPCFSVDMAASSAWPLLGLCSGCMQRVSHHSLLVVVTDYSSDSPQHIQALRQELITSHLQCSRGSPVSGALQLTFFWRSYG